MGKFFTRSPSWSLSLESETFTFDLEGRARHGSVCDLEQLASKPGLFWATVQLPVADGKLTVLRGISNAAAAALKIHVDARIKTVKRDRYIADLAAKFDVELSTTVGWVAETTKAYGREFTRRGWLSHEFKTKLDALKPLELERVLVEPELKARLAAQPAEVLEAIKFWRQPLVPLLDVLNARFMSAQLEKSKAFFDSVEKSPLTAEQAKAVVCLDNRVLLVAAAGSGKTSTMVAKAGYVLKNRFVEPEAMLLLAFNTEAAAELAERIKSRLQPLGLPADKVVAKTFHAFGLEVIGQATGRRPSLAPWVGGQRQEEEAVLTMVDELKEADPEFRTRWDIFRLVFGQEPSGGDADSPMRQAAGRQSDRGDFQTLNNETVRSRGEVLVANWLFYNGVRYQYEAPYKVDTATSEHRQYQPDFYLPDIDTYLEHWALDARGKPPAEFVGYLEGMAWKKQLHQRHGTRLLETTTAGLWSGQAFAYLEKELVALGVQLDPNPDRPAPGRPPLDNARLVKSIRGFMTHAKGNRLGMADLRKRLAEGVAGQFSHRHEMFLSIFERVLAKWESRLAQERVIDFDDMLNQAADHIEQGRWESPYELVMVDEFQDVSQSRARLIAGLMNRPGRHLFGVGDDWQSINRFAGADLGVMTDFEALFGKAVTLRLEATFRCPQSLCDISGAFVAKNPKQLRKSVRSTKPDVSDSVRIVRVNSSHEIRAGVEATLERLAVEAAEQSGKASVFLLGRYGKADAYMPQWYDSSRLTVRFVTVHSSKGLEADHVIVPGVTAETLGIPCQVEDDPVLQLAMPSGDAFPFAEERRLFYVALTRARKTATLVTVAGKESTFVTELVRDYKLPVTGIAGEASSSEVCERCKVGFVIPRRGKYGPFLACSNYPPCEYTRKLPRT